jgi:hypothetical protein
VTHVAYSDGAHVCYTLARDGRTRHYLGCSHRTPREAIRHEAPCDYVSPTSPAERESKPAASIPAGAAEAVHAQQETPEADVLDDRARADVSDPAAVPPAAGSLSLGL